MHHRPDKVIECAMAHGAKVKISPHSVDNMGVGLRQLLQMCLPHQSPSHVLSEKGNQLSFLLIRLCRLHICVVCRHDSQRESTRTMKGHVITAGVQEECWVISSKIAQN